MPPLHYIRGMSYETLRVEREGEIATVTLQRPDKANALDTTLMNEIIDASESFRGDAQTRVVVFTGAGKHFSAGADLTAMGGGEAGSRLTALRASQLGPRMLRAITEIDAITVAAINGVAAGGGACITTACDFRVGAADCRVSYPEVPLGMSLSWTSLPLCVHLIGPARAKRMVILGQKEDAATLLDWGFLDEVAPEGGLMEVARAMAERYAAMPPIPTQMVKRSVNQLTQALDRAIMHMDMDQLLLTHGTEDFREGMTAWLKKRPASFTGN